ncbi:hypothetical protein EW146_g8556 [Bondarzewia mesenterica]|uniref:Uncharacterized protein n=1 Tax=Bondarzewia mesenterica TaxID=1095465 RepID=A0A4S4LDD6_9AGAM|nr:hypothetical protein EW146_g8556 [Bondarzewia mesenterica]
MGIHYYNSSPFSATTMETRLKPARAITDACIPCLVWAEDALSFALFVPTELFALQLLVPDEDVRTPTGWNIRSSTVVNQTATPDSVALELTTPQSARHEDDPTDIFIHPSSYFSFDVCDHTLSVSLVPPLSPANSDLRFPTRTAFLDSMIATILDPPIGFRHGKLTQQLEGFISYIRLYTLRAYPRVLPNGNLEPEHAAVLASLRPENRHWFESKVRKTYKDWATQVQARRAILESIGCVRLCRSVAGPYAHFDRAPGIDARRELKDRFPGIDSISGAGARLSHLRAHRKCGAQLESTSIPDSAVYSNHCLCRTVVVSASKFDTEEGMK